MLGCTKPCQWFSTTRSISSFLSFTQSTPILYPAPTIFTHLSLSSRPLSTQFQPPPPSFLILVFKRTIYHLSSLYSPLVFISEPTLCQATLTCLAACISIDPESKEVLQLLSTNTFPLKQPTKHNKNEPVTKEASWLVVYCLQQLHSAGKGRRDKLSLVYLHFNKMEIEDSQLSNKLYSHFFITPFLTVHCSPPHFIFFKY